MFQWHWSVISDNWPLFLHGAISTVELVVITMATSIVLGLIVAVLCESRNKVIRKLAIAYGEIFRDTPLLLQLLMCYRLTTLSSFAAGYVALTLNLTAFLAEVYRSGLTSIGQGQKEAGMALGMTDRQLFLRIIAPQAIRRVIPPLGTFWVSLFRDSSLVSMIGVLELTHAAQQVASTTYRPLVSFTALAIMYMIITYPQARAVGWLYKKVRVHE